MTEAPTIDLAALRQLTLSGYGFYQNQATARADDLLVRAHAADSLHRLADTVAASIQSAHAALPPLTRENPFPNLAAIRTLRTLQDRIAALETRLRGPAALPNRDFSDVIPSESFRQNLVALDAALLAATSTLHPTVPSIAAAESALTARETFASRGKR